mmetsp:Transcript_35304/g.81764  ORF Transcript_35304/g.81764 Transcript_35304/m.81764 type:complete len:220 (+) Transcript_35304:939-1598(+)
MVRLPWKSRSHIRRTSPSGWGARFAFDGFGTRRTFRKGPMAASRQQSSLSVDHAGDPFRVPTVPVRFTRRLPHRRRSAAGHIRPAAHAASRRKSAVLPRLVGGQDGRKPRLEILSGPSDFVGRLDGYGGGGGIDHLAAGRRRRIGRAGVLQITSPDIEREAAVFDTGASVGTKFDPIFIKRDEDVAIFLIQVAKGEPALVHNGLQHLDGSHPDGFVEDG